MLNVFDERVFSQEAHHLWKEIEAEGNQEDIEEAKREITRVLLNVKYKIIQRAIVSTAQVEGLELLENDEDLINKSIELTSQ